MTGKTSGFIDVFCKIYVKGYKPAEVENTGKVDGETVVQMYIRDLAGSVTRPVKELKGFEKVALKAGEKKQVSFTIESVFFLSAVKINTYQHETIIKIYLFGSVLGCFRRFRHRSIHAGEYVL